MIEGGQFQEEAEVESQVTISAERQKIWQKMDRGSWEHAGKEIWI